MRSKQQHGVLSSPERRSSSAFPTPTAAPSPSAASAASSRACCCGLRLIVAVRLTFLLAVVSAVVFALLNFSEMKHLFLDCLVYVRQLGPLRGSLVLCAANIVGALLLMPCVPFTLGAGFLYGTLIGSIIVSIASTIAAVIAFLTARYLARQWIEKQIGSGNKFRILDRAIADDGFRMVFLIRSSPIHPFGLCNFVFGLTSVTTRDYTVASFFGMLPATVMEVFLGTAGKNISDLVNGTVDSSFMSRVFFWVGLGVSVVVTVTVTLLLKRKLASEMAKYSVVATNETDAADEDGFGMLSLGGEDDGEEHLELTAVHTAADDSEAMSEDNISVPIASPAKLAPDARKASNGSAEKTNKSGRRSQPKHTAADDVSVAAPHASAANANSAVAKGDSGSSTPLRKISASSSAQRLALPAPVTLLAPPPTGSAGNSPLDEEFVDERQSLMAEQSRRGVGRGSER